ncbi:MAG: hypothetical protein KJ601_05690 [Nanoarchaeota archaeon]|nr:hypothetical protein [Nanoarchaeota archaeon]
MRTAAVILIIAVMIICSACGSKEYCKVLDKRFLCEGKMDQQGSSIIFTKAPQGKFTIGRITLEKSEEESSGLRTDCSVMDGNIIEKGSQLDLDCRPQESGRYLVNMKIYHQEPASYSPVTGETCLKKGQTWNCDSSAFFAVNI